jgi:hypothetical protein
MRATIVLALQTVKTAKTVKAVKAVKCLGKESSCWIVKDWEEKPVK